MPDLRSTVVHAVKVTADAILGGCEIILGCVLALTERAVPFDEARAEAWLNTSAPHAVGAESPEAVSAGTTTTAPASGHPTPMAAVIFEVLAEHRFSPSRSSGWNVYGDCLCGYRPIDLLAWNAHVAPIISARITKAPK